MGPERDLAWRIGIPDAAGYYWYHDPASHEPPVLVRMELAGGTLTARFPDIPAPISPRMLAGAHWAGPPAGPP